MNNSFWLASTPDTSYPSLDSDIKTDVAIVGGGLVGILSAYLLKKASYKVAVLEAGRIAKATTGHTTAKITSQHNLIYDKLIRQKGKELARQYATANERAIQEIKKIADENNIECDYIPQEAYIYTQQDKYIEQIEAETQAALSLGIKAHFLEEIPVPLKIKAALRFDDQAQFHPRKFLLPLASTICGNNSQIYENSRVVDLEESLNYTLTTDQGKKVTAQKVIIASHYPFYNKSGFYFARIYPERSYIIAIQAQEKYPGGMYINAEEPPRSLRCQDTVNGQLILVVGDNHKTGQGEDTSLHYQALTEFAHETFTVKNIPFRWSTQDCMTLDGLPYVGQYTTDTPDLYVATGFGKWGMTNSMSAAMILRDLIVEGSSPWQEVYNPSRQTVLASAKNFVVENLDVAKHLIDGKIEGKISPLPENTEIKAGESKIMSVDGNRIGAFRDEQGTLHLINTTCTHMGCELNWNSAEQSWDCPCHGSRFSYDGDILEGPAVHPLSAEKETKTVSKLLTDEY
ncbi:MAG: FAD-dependent oxidoreductase [Peptococcaceae bacterium]|nr:FAD-dependent oxidoreductase [Peptococcaceae bacterium]